jgi:hypothetical protein
MDVSVKFWGDITISPNYMEDSTVTVSGELAKDTEESLRTAFASGGVDLRQKVSELEAEVAGLKYSLKNTEGVLALARERIRESLK